MIKPVKYARRPFYVDVVEVTEENMTEVAEWCGGKVRDDKDEPFIKVRVRRPLHDRQTMAFVGDMVLKAGTGFKVYTAEAFEKNFEELSEVDYDNLQEEKLFDPKFNDGGFAEALTELRTVNQEA